MSTRDPLTMTETQAWIIVANRKNMEKCARERVYGLNHGSQLPKFKIGDKLIAYIKGETTFGGLGEVTKEYYLDDKPLFEGGLFPNRIGIKLDLYPESSSVNVWNVTDELDFSKGKLHWQAGLVSGLRRISLEDYKRIQSSLEKKVENIK